MQPKSLTTSTEVFSKAALKDSLKTRVQAVPSPMAGEQTVRESIGQLSRQINELQRQVEEMQVIQGNKGGGSGSSSSQCWENCGKPGQSRPDESDQYAA